MVFTQAGDINLAHEDHLVVFFGENGVVDDVYETTVQRMGQNAGKDG